LKGNKNKMKYIFITDGYEPYINQFATFSDAICDFKEYTQGEKAYPVFNDAIQSLTPQQAIQLYNDLVYNDEAIKQVYELGDCIYDS
jgi:hypothetical protein